ncbi:MAG TPA: Ltp family lipoprotein [Candidatus Cloacimonas acidaminovorans]|mgnify:CR=1 FL=1|nr:Ltp family lipoprotein [Candidatus Cloacimonas acidaminovorans]
MSDQTTQSKKVTISLVLSWIFGILFALTGIFSIFSDPIPGLVMLVMATVILPPVTKIVDKKWKFSFSRGMKIGVIVIGLIIFGATVNSSSTDPNIQQAEKKEEQQFADDGNIINEVTTTNQIDEEQSQIKNNEEEVNEAEIISALNEKNNENYEEAKSPIPVVSQSPTPVKIEDKPESTQSETVSQRNAIRSAKSYLGYSAFSRSGLIKQLEYEKFSNSDAVYGVDNSGADWNEQAVKSAEEYMNYSSFSRGSLIEQLKYEGFTQAQAEYGVNAVGL